MLINQLADRTGVSARALRNYDRHGLLPSRRLGNGYRDFDECAVEEVRRIRLLLGAGLNLKAVALMLPCFNSRGELTACVEARDEITAQILEVDNSIADLKRTRGLLGNLLTD